MECFGEAGVRGNGRVPVGGDKVLSCSPILEAGKRPPGRVRHGAAGDREARRSAPILSLALTAGRKEGESARHAPFPLASPKPALGSVFGDARAGRQGGRPTPDGAPRTHPRGREARPLGIFPLSSLINTPRAPPARSSAGRGRRPPAPPGRRPGPGRGVRGVASRRGLLWRGRKGAVLCGGRESRAASRSLTLSFPLSPLPPTPTTHLNP